MHREVANVGRWMKGGLALLGVAAMAIPTAGAFAGETDSALSVELSAEQVEQARNSFIDWSCGACHALADGEGYGEIGPALDGNEALARDYVVERITNGQGAMPGFGGQLTDEEIAILADYIVQVKK